MRTKTCYCIIEGEGARVRAKVTLGTGTERLQCCESLLRFGRAAGGAYTRFNAWYKTWSPANTGDVGCSTPGHRDVSDRTVLGTAWYLVELCCCTHRAQSHKQEEQNHPQHREKVVCLCRLVGFVKCKNFHRGCTPQRFYTTRRWSTAPSDSHLTVGICLASLTSHGDFCPDVVCLSGKAFQMHQRWV